MKRRTRSIGALAAFLLSTAALTGCAAVTGPSGSSGSGDGVLRVAFRAADPSNLDPIRSTGATDNAILWSVYENLIGFDPQTLAPAPGLAESWAFEDETTLRLDLVEDASFHDGAAFNAEAVKANLDRARDPEGGGNLAAQLASIESVEVRDEYTAVLHLKEPAASILGTLADRSGMMVSPAAIESDPKGLARHPVGTGKYKFESWSSGNELKVVKNTDYWQGEPDLEGITFKMMPDPTARVNALRSGDVDFIYAFDPLDLGALEGDSNLETYSGPSIEYNALYTNMSQKPLDDVRVRRAISMAIDRDALAMAVTRTENGGVWLATSKSSWAFAEEIDGTPEYDPEGAKKLLAEAGYGDGISLSVVVPADQGNDRRADIVADQLKKIGIDVNVQLTDFNESVEKYVTGEFPAFIAPSTSGPDPAAIFRVQFTPSGFTNAGKYEDEEISRLILEGERTEDLEERAQVYGQLQQRVIELAFNIPLDIQPNVVAYDKRVKGFVPNLWAKPNFDDVYLAE